MTPTALGTFYCILSAVFYTLMGICQRELSQNCDPVLVNSVQASVSTAVFGVYLTWLSARGRSAWPPLAVALALMILGAITQLGGTAYQWSLGIVGLSIGNPLQMGVMLSASAVMGLVVLGERVSWRAVTAIALMTAAIYLLSGGAEEANQTVAPFWVMLGVAAACFSGVAFALLTVGMRKTARVDTSAAAIVFYINSMGVLFTGPWAWGRLGMEGVMSHSPRDFAVMLATGGCNLMAFLLIAKALQLTTVVRVNVINNAMATALTVLSGIAIFAEPAGKELIIGIVLTLVGIILIGSEKPPEETASASHEGG